jgi:hypothetical protein
VKPAGLDFFHSSINFRILLKVVKRSSVERFDLKSHDPEKWDGVSNCSVIA